MYALVDAPSQKANPKISFLADYRRANRAASVSGSATGESVRCARDGTVVVPVTVTTEDFGTLTGDAELQAERGRRGRGARRLGARAAAPRPRARARRCGGAAARRPQRGNIYDAGGRLLNSDPTGASIAGEAGEKPTGLERIYDDRLGGRRSVTLRFGDRVIKKIPGRRGPFDPHDDPARAAEAGRPTRWASRSAAWR